MIARSLALVAAKKMSAVLLLIGLAVASAADDTYLIGTGRYDVTGPAAEIEMVGAR